MTAALWSFSKQNKFRNEIVRFIWIGFFMWCVIFAHFKNLLQNRRQIQWNDACISNSNSNCTTMFEFLCNGFCGVTCWLLIIKGVIIFLFYYFQAFNDWGSCFSLVYYDWGSSCFGGVKIYRYIWPEKKQEFLRRIFNKFWACYCVSCVAIIFTFW